MPNSAAERTRPLSPNIQIYRPQLTSVLSIANRITGLVLSLGAVLLVVWLIAAARDHRPTQQCKGISRPGSVISCCWVHLAFFLHLCGGIRHLVRDTGTDSSSSRYTHRGGRL